MAFAFQPPKPAQGFALWLLLLALLCGVGGYQFHQGATVETDILAMLPRVQEDPLTQRALQRMEQQFSNRLYLALLANSRAEAIQQGQKLLQLLRQSPAFTEVQSADDQQLQSLGKLYFPYRMRLLTEQQRQWLQQGQLQPLIQQAQAQLYNPLGMANSELLAQDPLLLFPAWLQQLAGEQTLKPQQGILLAEHGAQVAALIMAQGQGSAFSPAAQQQQLQALNQALGQLAPGVQVLKAGALFHAAAATSAAKQEINIIGGVSLLGIMLLVLLCFRSPMPLLVAILTLASSFAAALSVTLLLFDGIHLLTLVFGTSLAGIAIDYTFHYYCKRLQDRDLPARHSLQQLLPTLALALLSSVAAYLALGLTPFPGMQQVAVFCATGLGFTWLTLLLAYPAIAARPLPDGLRLLSLAQQLYQRLHRPQAHTRWLLLGLAALLVLGMLRLHSNDDIRLLQQSPPQLTLEENQLRTLLSGGTDNQFLLLRATDEQTLLQRLAQLEPALRQLQQQQKLANFISLARFVPSQQQQQQDYQLQAQLYQQLPQILAQLQLDPALSAPLQLQFQQATHPLTLSHWQAAMGDHLLSQLWLPAEPHSAQQHSGLDSPKRESPELESSAQENPEQGAIILLGGIQDMAALRQLTHGFAGLTLVDKVADISTVMAHFRLLTLCLLALSLALAAGLFIWRYGTVQGLKIALVPIMAALLTLGSLGWLGAELTLFHGLALILVFGIGVDYSLFFAAAKEHTAAVLLAVLLSAISTLLAFGLLAFSSTHAIAVFGQTLALGIFYTLLLALLQPTDRTKH